MSDINVQLSQLLPAITAGIKTEMANIKREETRALGRQLKDFGVDIDELGATARDELISQASGGATPVELAALKFLNRELSPAYAEENPGTAAFLELSKVAVLQFIQENGGMRPRGNNPNTGKNISTGKKSPFG